VVVLVLSIKVLVEYTMLPSELAVEAAMGTAGVRLTMEGLVGSVEILVPFLVLFAQLFMDPTVLPWVRVTERRFYTITIGSPRWFPADPGTWKWTTKKHF